MSSRKSAASQVKSFIDQLRRKQKGAASEPEPEPEPELAPQSQVSMAVDTPQVKRPVIAILGAGIGGLALAIGLIKRGVACIIYESAKEFSVIGAGIGFGPNTLNAIEFIDSRFRERYDDAKTANERPEFENCVFDCLYAEEGFGEKRGWMRGIVGAPYFTRSSAHRKDLLEIMESFIPPGTVKFSKRAEDIQQVGNKVIVRFQDGETISVDALIGCDGIKGISRKAVLQDIAPEAVAPEYSNTYAYRGILPMKDVKEILGEHGGDAKWFMAKGKGVAIYPISKGKEENFVFFIRDDNPWPHGAITVDCTRDEMVADLEGFDPRLIKMLDWAKPSRWAVYHHRNTPTYYNKRVCMLGDVAHASTPYQAAGAGQGLEDAVVLANLLSLTKTPEELESAFKVYDSVRRPRATKVVETSYEAGLMYMWRGPEGEDMQKIVDNANGRLHWIWKHDLQADIDKAEADFLAMVGR